VVDCQSQEAGLAGLSEMSVADFFREYMKGTEREDKTIKKLKDWPAYTEFLEKFPDLYADFHQAMPVPDYTRRDGVWNVSAHVSGFCQQGRKR
jgi:lysine-specific demethylase 3